MWSYVLCSDVQRDEMLLEVSVDSASGPLLAVVESSTYEVAVEVYPKDEGKTYCFTLDELREFATRVAQFAHVSGTMKTARQTRLDETPNTPNL